MEETFSQRDGISKCFRYTAKAAFEIRGSIDLHEVPQLIHAAKQYRNCQNTKKFVCRSNIYDMK